jgi:catechol 2,3-dioxygenase-like lactoylglutathione lyase family enzyme
MSLHDRPLHHVAYLVDDLPTAVEQWVAATGAGPFIHLGDHVTFEETLLDGAPCAFDHASAIGRWGPVFLELMQLHEDVTPALERRLRPPGGAGGARVAHVAYLAEDPVAESARLEAAGMPQFLELREGAVRIAVHEAPLLGHPIEVHEDSEAINGLFATIAAAAEGWDGSDPLRAVHR